MDCIKVSCSPFKSSVEDLLQRLNDALMLCLRKDILSSFRDVDSYLEQGMEKLSTRPHSIDEIGQAKKEWKEIDSAREAMKTLTHGLLEKKRLLMQYAPGSNIDTSEVVSRTANLEGEGARWDTFEIALDAFNEMIEEQKESLRSVIDEEVMTLNITFEKFGQRWRALKPQELKNWEADEVAKVFSSLDDWSQQFKDLQQKAQQLSENCTAFGMPPPRFDGIDSTEADLSRTTSSWSMLREYLAELQAMSALDWIGFRANIFSLQDLAGKWQDKVKERIAEGTFDFVTQHLQSELERIKRALPALKYCRGEPFKEEHWSSLLQGKLGHPKTLRLENLVVGHFLSKLDILADPQMLSFVKHLQVRRPLLMGHRR